VTVPVLWDTKEETIVNNESREIIRMLSTGFGDVAERDVDLAPEAIREEVDEIITDIYEPINNGVYRAGFATKQGPYDEAVDELFDALDHWDSVRRPTVPRWRPVDRGRHLHVYDPHSVRSRLPYTLHV